MLSSPHFYGAEFSLSLVFPLSQHKQATFVAVSYRPSQLEMGGLRNSLDYTTRQSSTAVAAIAALQHTTAHLPAAQSGSLDGADNYSERATSLSATQLLRRTR